MVGESLERYCETEFREKENTSKVYIKCNAAGDEFYVQILSQARPKAYYLVPPQNRA